VDEHPSRAELEQLLSGALAYGRMRSIVRHLRAGCAPCRALVASHTSLGPQPLATLPMPRTARTARTAQKAQTAQKARIVPATAAADAARELDAAPPAIDAMTADQAEALERTVDRALAAVVRYGMRAVRESKKVDQVLVALAEQGLAGFCRLPRHLRGLAAYDGLLQRSWALRFDDPQQMVQLCELATVVAGGLSPQSYGSDRVRDLQCRAAIELANAYRVSGRTDEAQASLNEAFELFRLGTRNRLMAARLFVIQGHVSGMKRSFDNAFVAFDSAIKLYRQYGEPHQVADTLITKGMYCGYACRAEEALKLLGEALAQLDSTTHPELTLLAVYNIANLLVDGGRFREARTLLWRHLPVINQGFGGHALRVRLKWLDARIHTGIGELDRAERDLEETRSGFQEVGDQYRATVVSLEMAVLHLRQGRDEDARREAMDAADVFLGLNIGREAAVAMMLLKSTVKFRLATTTVLLEEMAQFMRAAEHDPKISFHPFLS